MFIDINKRVVNIYAPYTNFEGTIFGNLTNPAVRELLGIVEIPEPTPPEDYSSDTYYRTEQEFEPYVVYTKKSDEQIKQIADAKVQAQIDFLESSTMLPRVTREFMLLSFAAQAAAQTPPVDPMTSVAYKKLKELDDQIAALRSQLG
jgi:hypothetical protein